MRATPRTPRPVARAAALLAASALLLGACGDGGGDADATTDAAGDVAPRLEVTDAWARTSPRTADAGAVYLRIANDGDADDALVGVEVDTAVAARAELHETVAVEDGGDGGQDGGMDDGGMDDGGAQGDAGHGGGTGGGMMEMRPVDRIVVPAGGEVVLEPGGLHVMLLDLAAPLEAGSSVELTLEFEESGEQVVTADVRDEAP